MRFPVIWDQVKNKPGTYKNGPTESMEGKSRVERASQWLKRYFIFGTMHHALVRAKEKSPIERKHVVSGLKAALSHSQCDSGRNAFIIGNREPVLNHSHRQTDVSIGFGAPERRGFPQRPRILKIALGTWIFPEIRRVSTKRLRPREE